MASRAFARGDLVDLLAELLPAVELARICSVSTRFYRHAAALARAAIRAQHGLMVPDASLAEMHTFDSLPAALTFDLRARAARVLRGSPMRTTYVGSYKDRLTLSQIPPDRMLTSARCLPNDSRGVGQPGTRYLGPLPGRTAHRLRRLVRRLHA